MTAAASLRVLNNCAIGGCAAMDLRRVCPGCVHWKPSRSSKYYHCARWQAQRVTCELPRGACATCEHHITKEQLPGGRPAELGIDWTNPDEVRQYNREYARRRRARVKNEPRKRKSKSDPR